MINPISGMVTKVSQAEEIVGGHTSTSKMPGNSANIPATECVTGSKLVNIPGSVCHGCYALKRAYTWPVVKAAMSRRYDALNNPLWVEAQVFLLNARAEKQPYFRWHDSGDIQSIEHLWKIALVAELTPKVRHWLPTREYAMVREYIAQYGDFPPNLCVRVSTHMIDAEPPSWWPTTSTVHDESSAYGRICPAPSQGGKCGDCRSCWDRGVGNISYHKH